MASLFAKKKRKRQRPEKAVPSTESAPVESCAGIVEAGESEEGETDATFKSVGLCDWLLQSCTAMGFKRPTPVQKHCIPPILEGRDVIGCAETGSGKTAAFALPILHKLSKDPYGVYAVVLTPTRELAVQLSEQFGAFGALMGLRHVVVIGGMSMLEQGVELDSRPHIVIATPGRLRDHLQGPQPPYLNSCRFLVLDEADRLLSMGFESELRVITAALPKERQTLLFSATMTRNLEVTKALALNRAVEYDLTKNATVPATLTEQYLFMPAPMKLCFLVQLLRVLGGSVLWGEEAEHEDEDEGGPQGAQSVIVFVGSCKGCNELSETLLQLKFDCVCLHSMMTQPRRLAALGKFKSSLARIMVTTDVAGRGLDIPDVDLVVNYNMPRVATDYVHRVGRTARAGKRGTAVSLVSQYEVDLVHNVEEYTSNKLQLCEAVKEEEVLKIMNAVNKASRTAKVNMQEQGFDEQSEKVQERRKRDKAKRRRKREKEAS
ncbi:unnamed protein product [Chrysoparadoxa australica]